MNNSLISKTSNILRRGFTLIELLVVIAIIGLLSAVILSSLNTARTRGNDSRRVQEMVEIQKAVEAYYSDNGHYPNSNGTWTSFDSASYAGNPIVSPNAANLTAALSSYIGPVIDPRSATLGADAGNLYIGSGNNYCILVYRTPENMSDFKSNQIDYATGRCGSIVNGQCSGVNAIYVGVGIYANGC